MPEIRLIGIQLTEIGAVDLRTLSWLEYLESRFCWLRERRSNLHGPPLFDNKRRCICVHLRYILTNMPIMNIDPIKVLIYATDAIYLIISLCEYEI